MNTFAERLLYLRKVNDLTQKELRDKLEERGKKVTIQSVSSWENRGVEPSYSILIALKNIFNVSIEYLLGIEDLETRTDILDEQRKSFLKDNIQASLQKIKINEETQQREIEYLKFLLNEYRNKDIIDIIKNELEPVGKMQEHLLNIINNLKDVY